MRRKIPEAVTIRNVVVDAAGNAYHSADGHVISLSPDGLERWSVELPNAGPLFLGHGGEVVVTVDHKKIYVIGDVAARAATPPSH